MWLKLLGGLIGILVVPVFLLAGGVFLNRPMLSEPPGSVARLRIYLRYNSAETVDLPLLPELRIRRYQIPMETAQQVVENTFLDLSRWELRSFIRETGSYEAVVTTLLWRFKDDVVIRIIKEDSGIKIYQRSSSRKGRGDLGANRRHIIDFYEAFELRLNQISN